MSGHFALDSTDEIHLDEKSCGSWLRWMPRWKNSCPWMKNQRGNQNKFHFFPFFLVFTVRTQAGPRGRVTLLSFGQLGGDPRHCLWWGMPGTSHREDTARARVFGGYDRSALVPSNAGLPQCTWDLWRFHLGRRGLTLVHKRSLAMSSP